MRQLQLKRFDIIFKDRATALANLKKHENTYLDGEIMAAAYYTQEGGNNIINYIIGIYADKGGNQKKLVTIDISNIETQIADIKKFIQNTLVYVSDVDLVIGSTYTNDTTDKYKVKKENGADKFFRLFFTPISADNQKVSVTIGDIKAGMTALELKKYTLSKLIDAMLFKTIYPTILNNPSASMARPTVNGAAEVEVGTSIAKDGFKLAYTPGKAQVLMESGNLPVTADTGNETSRAITYKFGNGATTNFNANLVLDDLGTYSFTGTVNYAGGEILHDSKGGTGDTTGIEVFASKNETKTVKRANPHAAGSVTATTTVATYYKPGANTGTNTSDYSDIVKLNIKAVKGMIVDFKIKENVNAEGKVVAGGAYQIAVPHAIWNGVKGKILKYNAGADAFNGDDTNNWTLTPNALKLTDASGKQYDCDLLEHNVGAIGNDGTGNARVAFKIN